MFIVVIKFSQFEIVLDFRPKKAKQKPKKAKFVFRLNFLMSTSGFLFLFDLKFQYFVAEELNMKWKVWKPLHQLS